jgi:hypothetical protein
MKQVCKAFLFVFLGLSGFAQESAAPRVAIPLIASDSHHQPTTVTVESLVIRDQKMPVTGASLLRGADLPSAVTKQNAPDSFESWDASRTALPRSLLN